MDHGGPVVAEVENVVPLRLGGREDLLAATDTRLGRRVAIRTLAPPVDDEAAARLEHDCRVYGLACAHPRVVTLYRFEPEGPHLVLELIDGIDLHDHLRRVGPMPWTEAVDLVLGLADGLGRFHQAGRFHLDLQPRTILHGPSGLSLTDVGLIDAVPPTPPGGPGGERHLAPERRSDPTDRNLADPRTDLYALTAVLAQMINGGPPEGDPADPAERATEVGPAALATFVAAGLSPVPADRPQSAEEFRRELALIRQGRTTGPTGIPALPTAPSPALPTAPSPNPQPNPTNGPAPVVPELTNSRPIGAHGPPDPPDPAGPGGEPRTTTPGPDPSAPAPMVVVDPTTPIDLGQHDLAQHDPGQHDPARPTGAALLGTEFEDGPGPGAGPDLRNRLPVLAAASVILLALIGGLVALTGGDETGAPPLPTTNGRGVPAGAVAESPGPLAVGSGMEADRSMLDADSPAADAMADGSTTTALPASTTTTRADIRLPDLVGQDVGQAGGRLAELGLEVLVVGRVAPGTAPGTVIEQVPAGGRTVTPPLTVTLYIPRSSTLPELVGQPADTACVQLRALGLTCNRTPRFDDQVRSGTVIATDPVAGSPITDGQAIEVVVSRGPVVDLVVPDVAGTDEVEARTALESTGFPFLTVAVEASGEVPQGRVIGTDPPAGSTAPADSPVTIRLSSGPPTATDVPDLVGRPAAEAEAALIDAGLQVAIVEVDREPGDPDIGLVVSVEPGAGSTVDVGSTVTIVVGRAVEPDPPTGTDPPSGTDPDPDPPPSTPEEP